VAQFDRSGGFQQRHDIVPFDVVARRVLKDLQKSVALMGVQVLGS
jgi:hypothetical protein